MIYNKQISFLIFFFLLACSKDNNVDLSNAENVFQPKLNVSFVNEKDNLIIHSSHPSPYSACNGFFGSKPFSKTNEYLRKHNLMKIGSSAPDNIVRGTYENAYLSGDIYNKNADILLHNWNKDEES